MVRKYLLAAFALILILSLLPGCIKTRDETDCANIADPSQPVSLYAGEAAMCYHEAAMGHALRSESDAALADCQLVETTGGVIAQSEANNCYNEIAGIMKNQTICSYIKNTVISQPTLFDAVTSNFTTECMKGAEQKPPSDLKLCAGFVLGPLAFLFLLVWRKSRF